MAEDWAPFDVDITTELPPLIDSRVLWTVVARQPSDFGFRSGIGGISLFNRVSVPFGIRTPTFTFWGSYGPTNHPDIADNISQENGHMFGLLHRELGDGRAHPRHRDAKPAGVRFAVTGTRAECSRPTRLASSVGGAYAALSRQVSN